MVMIVASALALWRGMAILSNCESPIVVVLRQSYCICLICVASPWSPRLQGEIYSF
jgi:hypothetical protein